MPFYWCNMENFFYKKSFGQNFLHDENIINNIVKCSNIKPNSLVIEIGPGSGALTKVLVKNASNVLCYEIDTRLEDELDKLLHDFNNIEIIFDDFLKRDIKKDISKYNYDNIYVIANLPYYITTPIINKLIDSNITFNGITIMIQKEVAERFMTKPGSRNYGSITVFLNYYFDITKLFVVSRNAFTPKPNVDSMVINLSSKENKVYLKSESNFFILIKDAFRYKRKNIRNNLANYDLNIILKVLEKYHYDLTVRSEELPIEVFAEISNSLN